ncbi:Cysteine desulfurase [Pseudoalteromonas luteoviolacea B = ATCC 29581]|nr:Cysteine desulfurase [Pseudoalteromonas luteoviolacea B = ATCC 29581]
MSFEPKRKEEPVYLDANATTPVLPAIVDVVTHAMKVCYGNPSSAHITGVQAKHLLEQARARAKQLVQAGKGDILFTSGATEGIQTAIVSALLDARKHTLQKPVLLYGATEHKAVPNTLKHWNSVLEIHAEVLAIPVDKNGLLDLRFIEDNAVNALVICTMAVNNETGVIQDLRAIENAIRSRNTQCAWMVDCVQAMGKVNLALYKTTIDYAPFSGHKLYAPKGIGMLYIREGAPYTPFIAGGGQESGMRSGTENLPGIASLNELCRLLLDENDTTFRSHEELNEFRNQLKDAIEDTFEEVTFHHEFKLSVPTTLNFSVNNLTSKEVIDLFDAAGIRVSGGSACSSGSNRSFVLDAMGRTNWESENAIRLSFGPADTRAQIETACQRIRSLKPILAQNCLIVSDSQYPNQEACAVGLTQFRHQGACSWLYVASDRSAVIIDPIVELLPRMERLIEKQKLNVQAVLDTHAHQDRESGRVLFAQNLQLAHDDTDELGWPKKLESLRLAENRLEKLATPGHSKDSVSYLLCNDERVSTCFCGDMVLPHGLGATNKLGGDTVALGKSLLALNERLLESTVICSAHDYKQCFAITWAVQKQQIPLLAALVNQDITLDDFVEQHALQSECEHRLHDAKLCGFVNAQASEQFDELSSSDAVKWIKTTTVTVIDIREPYEHSAQCTPCQILEQATTVLNIPLTRMADALISERVDKDGNYLLLCRTGNRSRQATVTLKNLGFKHVFNLKGGVALS